MIRYIGPEYLYLTVADKTLRMSRRNLRCEVVDRVPREARVASESRWLREIEHIALQVAYDAENSEAFR